MSTLKKYDKGMKYTVNMNGKQFQLLLKCVSTAIKDIENDYVKSSNLSEKERNEYVSLANELDILQDSMRDIRDNQYNKYLDGNDSKNKNDMEIER